VGLLILLYYLLYITTLEIKYNHIYMVDPQFLVFFQVFIKYLNLLKFI
jgi:hypothetical protein